MTKEEKLLAKGATLANIILTGAGVVCLLALSYFVYYYAWTGQRQFTSWAGVLLYYVSPALLAILLFASLRLSVSRKINLALFLCSAGAAIYAVETLLAVWFHLPSVIIDQIYQSRIESALAQGIDFDTRSKRQMVDDLRSRSVDAVPSVFPNGLFEKQPDGTRKSLVRINGVDVLPLAGISNKLTVLCNESGQYLTYKSDDHGFNNPQNLWDDAAVDIVTVGDSYVQGYCVPTEDNFVSLIRKRYPATLNLGIEGNGPLVMLATIKEYTAIVKPKVVLWFYYENDLIDLNEEKNSPLLMHYLTEGFSQGLFVRQPEIDRALTDYVEMVKRENKMLTKLKEISDCITDLRRLPGLIVAIIKLNNIRTRLGLVQGTGVEDPSKPDPALVEHQPQSMRDDINLFYQILSEARKSVSQWGGNLYFVFLPAWQRYAPRQAVHPGRDQILLAANKAGLPVIDLHHSFVAQKDPLALFPPAPLESHYNKDGHRLVAEEVRRSVSVGK